MVSRLGRYEVLAELGRGGFGHVYRGLDPTLGSPVAIKMLIAGGDQGMLTRFRGEAAAARRLRHPNIITVYDFGEQDGAPFIVMELLDGRDLEWVITTRYPLTMLHKLQILAQVASGLRHAHAAGIIHRDVKPANIMLLRDGSIKIMDFGIARATRSAESRLTPHGAMIGTLRYMAPEQFMGLEPDPRSDIFAYGLIFYELLTGVHPFNAPEPAGLMYNLLNRQPAPLGELCSDCPPDLQSVVSRLLQKEPDLRYQSLDDVLFDIEPALQKLREEKVGELLAQARSEREQGKPESAQGLIRRALELAPTHEQARRFREELQVEVRRHEIRPKLQELLQRSRDALAGGNPMEAVQRLESAIRLDPADTEIRALLDQARAAAGKADRAARLRTEAENALRAGDTERARALALEAVELGDSGARPLLERADAGVVEERRKARLGELVARVRSLIGSRSWEQASVSLNEIAKNFPGLTVVGELRAELLSAWERDERARALEEGLAAARRALARGDPDGAMKTLQDLALQYPESLEAAEMLRAAQVEAEARTRRAFVQRAIEEASAAAAQNDFDRAKRSVENALARHPADPDLERERERIAAAAMEAALASAKELRAQGKPADGIRTLDSLPAPYAHDRRVTSLRETLSNELEAALREADLRDLLDRAESLIEGGQPEEAADLLRSSPQAANRAVKRLLASAERSLRQRLDRKAALDRALAEARRLFQNQAFGEANRVLGAFREKHGPDEQAGELEQQAEKAERNAQRLVADLCAQVEDLLNVDPVQAAEKACAAPPEIRDRPEVREIEEAAVQAAREWRANSEADDLARHARELVASGDFSRALAAVNEGLSGHPGHLLLVEARDEALAAQRRSETLAAVEALAAAHRYDEALRKLGEARRRDPGEAEYSRLEASITGARDAWMAEQAESGIREKLERARRSIPGQPEEAVAALEALRRQHPGRADLDVALKEAREAAGRKRRDALLAEVARLCERQEFDAALEELNATGPDADGEIADSRERVLASRERAQRAAAAQAAEAALGMLESDPHKALTSLRALPAAVRARQEVASAIEQCQTAVVAAERRAMLEKIDDLLRRGKRAKARRLHASAVQRFGNDGAIEGLLSRLEAALPEPRRGRRWSWVAIGGLATAILAAVAIREFPHRAPPRSAAPSRPEASQPAASQAATRQAPASQPPAPQTATPVAQGRRTGTLVVDAGTRDALVYVDGVPAGRTDASGRFSSTLEAAKHSIRVERSGFDAPPAHTVEIASNQRRLVQFRLTATPQAQTPPAMTAGRGSAVVPPAGVTAPQPPADVAEQEWARARVSPDPAVVQGFLQKYPGGPHADEAQARLEALFWGANGPADAGSLRLYLTRFPNGAHRKEVQARVEELAWDGLDKGNAQELRSFIGQYPNDPHRSEAQASLDRLEKQQQAGDERPGLPKANDVQTRAEGQQGIRDAIAEFNGAFTKREPTALKQIWPEVPKDYLEGMKQPGVSFIMRLQPTGEPLVTGDTTSLACLLVSETTLRGRVIRNQKNVKVTFARSAGRWLIAKLSGS